MKSAFKPCAVAPSAVNQGGADKAPVPTTLRPAATDTATHLPVPVHHAPRPLAP